MHCGGLLQYACAEPPACQPLLVAMFEESLNEMICSEIVYGDEGDECGKGAGCAEGLEC